LEKCIKLAYKNWFINREELLMLSRENKIMFRVLDWSNYANLFDLSILSYCADEMFRINENDLINFENLDIIIAADVIYDNEISVKFLNTLYKIFIYGKKKRKKVCYISNEKRINFSIETLSSDDNAYNYFLNSLNELNNYVDSENGYRFEIEEIENSQIMNKFVKNYERNNYLFLWKIECIPLE
jgi:hypothetical protein